MLVGVLLELLDGRANVNIYISPSVPIEQFDELLHPLRLRLFPLHLVTKIDMNACSPAPKWQSMVQPTDHDDDDIDDDDGHDDDDEQSRP